MRKKNTESKKIDTNRPSTGSRHKRTLYPAKLKQSIVIFASTLRNYIALGNFKNLHIFQILLIKMQRVHRCYNCLRVRADCI